jgi:phosphonate transport system permease protein
LNQANPRSWKRPPFIESSLLRWGLITGGALFLVISIGTMEVNWERVAAGLPRAERFLASFFPPDFTSKSTDIRDGIIESLWMTVVSTVIGILLSIPVGLGAARNLSPRYV